MAHLYILIALMLFAGVLGGIINFFLHNNEPIDDIESINGNQPHKSSKLIEPIIIGIGASLLVPLFLNMISSTLLVESEQDPNLLLVIMGFCLVASISSKNFIQGVSSRIFKELKETKKEIKQVKQNESLRTGEEEEDLENELKNDEIMQLIESGIRAMKPGESKSLRQIFNNNEIWKSIPYGARRGLGRKFWNLVNNNKFQDIVDNGKNKYGNQLYKKIE